MAKRLPAGERTALLLAANTTVCYRPECRVPLVVNRGQHRICNFEIAHIRDENPPKNPTLDIGWRYWPDDLTRADRNGFDNLLLLCPPCHKLIDHVRPRDFSPALLHEWKRRAEGDALEAETTESLDVNAWSLALADAFRARPRLVLSLPSLSGDDGLSFASRTASLVGRLHEDQALSAFLTSESVFSWWTIVGEAGVGKSRLALECCLAAEEEWDVGFVRDGDQEALLDFVPGRPTLIVVDYAAARAEWLGQFLDNMAHRVSADWEPVRVLVLDRTVNAKWYEAATRQTRYHDSLRIMSARHAEPLELRGLSRDSTRKLIADFVSRTETPVSSTTIEKLVDRAFELDPAGRPLFSLVAALEYFDPQMNGGVRDMVLRGLVKRRQAHTAGDTPLAFLVLEIAATALGGVDVRSYPKLGSLVADPFRLPALSELSAEVIDRVLSGMVPDILGEMWVLDALEGKAAQAQACQAALDAAWEYSSQRYAAFVDRAARDHPLHKQLLSLLNVDCQVNPDAWFEMVCAAIPHLRDPRSPRIEHVLGLLNAHPASDRRERALLEAGFAVANLWLARGVLGMAHTLYTELIETAPVDSEVRWQSYTNRGVVELELGNRAQGEEDFAAVISSSSASDEAQACCLNNRADQRMNEGDHLAAIEDRTAVLRLRETSYNRRYIALIRRARSLWALHRYAEASDDIDAILSTTDIAVEQKMAARLMRAEWAAGTGVPEVAKQELKEILASRRNFDEISEAARNLALDLGMLDGSTEPATGDDGKRSVPPTAAELASRKYFSRVRGPI